MKLGRIAALVALTAAVAAPAALAGGGPFADAVHGDLSLQLKDGSTKALTYDKGKITAKTATTLTIQRANGSSVTLSYDSSTVVKRQGETYSAAGLTVGMKAMFFSQGGKALFVRCLTGGDLDPNAEVSDQPGLLNGVLHGTFSFQLKDGSSTSSTYDRGKITAITATTFTVKRADKSTVTLSYDANTVVRDKGTTEPPSALTVGEGAMFFSRGGTLFLVRCISGG
jgi:hypothetical protein